MLMVSAKKAIFMKNAEEREVRFHPKSISMGLNMTLKAYRAPDWKKRMKKQAHRTYHPKNRQDLLEGCPDIIQFHTIN
jgi:hypothetical protein